MHLFISTLEDVLEHTVDPPRRHGNESDFTSDHSGGRVRVNCNTPRFAPVPGRFNADSMGRPFHMRARLILRR